MGGRIFGHYVTSESILSKNRHALNGDGSLHATCSGKSWVHDMKPGACRKCKSPTRNGHNLCDICHNFTIRFNLGVLDHEDLVRYGKYLVACLRPS